MSKEENNKILSPEEFWEAAWKLNFHWESKKITYEEYFSQFISLITSRDALICKAQKKACGNSLIGGPKGFKDSILNAPDAI